MLVPAVKLAHGFRIGTFDGGVSDFAHRGEVVALTVDG